jgi:hypothetical protein
VAVEIPLLYCPSNRKGGSMDLTAEIYAWGGPMPPRVGSTDYILCKGANAAIHQNAGLIPLACRGVFNVYADSSNPDFQNLDGITDGLVVRLTDITDGTTTTFAIGEGAGNTPRYLLREMNVVNGRVVVSNRPATNPYTGQTIQPDQAWSAASIAGENHPWYTSVFGVTAQYGLGSEPRDEPMNNRLVMPAAYADTEFGLAEWSGDNETKKESEGSSPSDSLSSLFSRPRLQLFFRSRRKQHWPSLVLKFVGEASSGLAWHSFRVPPSSSTIPLIFLPLCSPCLQFISICHGVLDVSTVYSAAISTFPSAS